MIERFLLPFLHNLRAGARSWVTTLAGIGIILVGIFGANGISVDQIIAGIALIFARDAGKSSQDSLIRPEPVFKAEVVE